MYNVFAKTFSGQVISSGGLIFETKAERKYKNGVLGGKELSDLCCCCIVWLGRLADRLKKGYAASNEDTEAHG